MKSEEEQKKTFFLVDDDVMVAVVDGWRTGAAAGDAIYSFFL